MTPGWAGALQAATLALILIVAHRPVGDYLARTFTSARDWRIERGVYRLLGVDPTAEQSWQAYLRGVLLFSLVGLLFVYALQRAQAVLPGALGLPAVPPDLAFNTAASFLGNTNWQSYAPEATVGYLVQLTGLAVQNFLSAAVGIAVAIALVRGFARVNTGTIGNVWVDLSRTLIRVLIPGATVAAIVLLAGGVIQNLNGFTEVQTLLGQRQTIPGGPVASQEAIKLLGTNGGGFFNANSAHPFENPTPWTNLFQNVLMLIIPFSLPRAFGVLVGQPQQGRTIVAVMAGLYAVSLTALSLIETAGRGTAPALAGAALEGKELRFGVLGSALFATTSTGTSTGAVNSMHDSYTALGGMLPMLNMMLGEVSPGGVGTGLYAILILAVLAVFIGGLLIGRSPEYLGKRIGPRQITLASFSILVMPALVLTGTALSFAVPALRDSVTHTSILNPGSHGLSEVLYAFTSAANNNGSAFAGLTAHTPWLNWALGVAILLGRFLPIVFVLALAGSLAEQGRLPASAGTLPTDRPLFAGLLAGVTVLVTALTFFPVLTLGPLAEGLQ